MDNDLLSLNTIDQITILRYKSKAFECLFSLQGAQLLHWQPQHEAPIIFTSPEASFISGVPIRGGIPVCWPWFGRKNSPMHGFARLLPWSISTICATEETLHLTFTLTNSAESQQYTEYPFKLDLEFQIDAEICTLCLTHDISQLNQAEVTAALHTYFQIGDITQIEVRNHGALCFNAITQTHDIVDDPRDFSEHFDCYYSTPHTPTCILDKENLRMIKVDHHASEVVMWNPWEDLADMSFRSSRIMICIESAYINTAMGPDDQLKQTISYERINKS